MFGKRSADGDPKPAHQPPPPAAGAAIATRPQRKEPATAVQALGGAAPAPAQAMSATDRLAGVNSSQTAASKSSKGSGPKATKIGRAHV